MKNVICQNKFLDKEHCGWVSFQVSLPYCKKWEREWQIYWDSLDEVTRGHFGAELRAPKIEDSYLHCHRCGGSYKKFRDATKAESAAVSGSTINPILNRNSKYKPRKLGKRRKND